MLEEQLHLLEVPTAYVKKTSSFSKAKAEEDIYRNQSKLCYKRG